ncbi:sensor histidine kinase [Acidaminobacter hydrogenoformans]|uniref:histidine kinase n=1 Tax=Acidaminobacter hydrogenoformans DSM 2784 TaxID=1120920 RepID=A0A1G5RYN2_9FIRM|nr:HAMP domain-containing sensor histidine kinase [Acidaminobacter hydrogenoformans]SCZ79106.1 Signal transduction histidine kinase [Acidaminobacter hydrogenoformans DSM 2784]
MDTKLKSWTNWSRHWFTKATVILLILAAGLIFSNTLFDEAEGTLFDFDYRSSQAYKDLDTAYDLLFEAISETPAAVQEAPGAESSGLEWESLKNRLPEGALDRHYFMLLKDGNLLSSNLEGLTATEDFYTLVDAHSELAGPSEGMTILIGLRRDIARDAANTWHETWLEENTPILILLTACILIMLSGLIYLAAVAGRRPHSDELHFLKADRIFTDLGLALWAGLQILLLGLFGEILRFADSEWQLLTKPAAGLFLTLSGGMALYAWSLFWKRLKTGSLLRHTFVVWCASKCFGALAKPLRKAARRLKSGPVDRMPLLIATGFLALNAFTILFGGLLTAAMGFAGFLLGSVVYLAGIALLALYLIRQDQVLARIENGLAAIEAGALSIQIVPEGPARLKSISSKVRQLADGYQTALESALKSERMKTELITNVSHDLKTPLTSILNYIDLLKRAGLTAPEAPEYLKVLDQKSQRLKTLTEDLFEAAKASSGSLSVQAEPLALQEFLLQSAGEVRDRMEQAQLDLKLTLPPQDPPITVYADGRHLWRIIENLFLNVLNYAMPGSRVYLDLKNDETNAVITMKNISALPLTDLDETLTDRFVRGDAARSTEGSGLGLAIAKSLAELQKGHFAIETDGDLFKAILTLPRM